MALYIDSWPMFNRMDKHFDTGVDELSSFSTAIKRRTFNVCLLVFDWKYIYSILFCFIFRS